MDLEEILRIIYERKKSAEYNERQMLSKLALVTTDEERERLLIGLRTVNIQRCLLNEIIVEIGRGTNIFFIEE